MSTMFASLVLVLCMAVAPMSAAYAAEDAGETGKDPMLGYVLGLKGVEQLQSKGYAYSLPWLTRGVRDAASKRVVVDDKSMRDALALWRKTTGLPEAEQREQAMLKQGLAGQTGWVSYTLGTALWNQLYNLEPTLDADLVVEALQDGLGDGEVQLGFLEAKTIYEEWQDQRNQEKEREQREANLAKGERFLEENAAKPGVNVTDEGLQYKVLQEGKGPSPAVTDLVKVRYTGWLLNGRQFDSSQAKGDGVELEVARMIPAWQIALTQMNPGSKWRIWAPAELAYGSEQVDPRIPPGSTLLFEIELVSFTDRSDLAEAYRKKIEAEMMKGIEFVGEYSQRDDVKALGKGALYRVLQEGDGPSPTLEDVVRVHYKGRVVGGEQFEDTYVRDKPVIFPLGEVLQGWRLALPEMQVGSKWELVVPPALGLGLQGGQDIPPGATLVFELELVDILDEVQRKNFKALREGTSAMGSE